MAKVSIVVPVYNVEDKLQRCLDSVLAQTFSDYELIIVDDGSTDKSGKICDNYKAKNKNITVMHKTNGGLSDARNAGLKIARGDYIMFLDSDDYITPDCLSVLYKENIDFVVGTIFWAYENGNVINQTQRDNEKINKSEFDCKLPQLLGERRLNYVHAKLYSRKIIVENCLSFEDDMLTSAEDTVFNFTFLRYCKNIYVVGIPVHYYMQSSTGLASKFYTDRYQRFKRLNNYIEETCKYLSVFNSQMESQINTRRVFSAIWCIEGIIKQKHLSFHVKSELLDSIFEDCDLKKAIKNIQIDGADDVNYLLCHGSRRLLLHKAIKRIEGKIIFLLYRITPDFIKKYFRQHRNKLEKFEND